MSSLSILNKNGKETRKMDLPVEVFANKVNRDILYQAIVKYQASLRQGTASTKTRSDVSGGGRKPWRQKGTGRARAGSSRSPLWHKGGVVFGPHPRDFGYTIPKKIKKAALRESLNAKYKTENLICLDEIKEKITKTKDFAKVIDALKLQGKTLALLEGCDDSIKLSSRNLPRFYIMRAEDVSAFDIIRNRNLLLTQTAFKKLMERIKE